ncbi:MAG: response regulator [Betaproteobacteria bacterium]
MNCPRCKTSIAPLADPTSIVTCPGCGSRLMTRAAAMRSQGSSRPETPTPSPPTPALANVKAADLPPSATLPATPARLLRATAKEPEAGRKTDGGSKRKGAGARAEGSAAAPPAEAVRPAALELLQAKLDLLVHEVRALRATQEHVLELLAHGRSAPSPSSPAAVGEEASAFSPIRAGRRKTVVLIDDDPQTREAAVAEMLQADVPVRAFADGSEALSGIAEDKPDVIVLELGLGGEMAGKDVINMIKATMEWVDLPIVLWTREPVSNQKEARQVHGADEIVLKSAGAGALVARVITLFRRV